MEKKKLIVISVIGIILLMLPVLYFGVMSIVSPAPDPIIPLKPDINSANPFERVRAQNAKLSLVIEHEYVNEVIAVIYQSLAFLLMGDFIVSSIMNFSDKEKSKEEKWKEFFIKLIIVLIISIALMLLAKVIWDLGAIQIYEWY